MKKYEHVIKTQEVLQKIKGVKEQRIDLQEVINYINTQSPQSEVYVGGDSDVYRYNDEQWILFIVIIGVHIDGCKGVKLFKQAEWVRDYSKSMRQRLITEVSMIVSIAGNIMDKIGKRNFEIHLDINSNSKYASSSVLKEAIGYVKGTLGVDAKVKPESVFASNVADHYTKL